MRKEKGGRQAPPCSSPFRAERTRRQGNARRIARRRALCAHAARGGNGQDARHRKLDLVGRNDSPLGEGRAFRHEKLCLRYAGCDRPARAFRARFAGALVDKTVYGKNADPFGIRRGNGRRGYGELRKGIASYAVPGNADERRFFGDDPAQEGGREPHFGADHQRPVLGAARIYGDRTAPVRLLRPARIVRPDGRRHEALAKENGGIRSEYAAL